MIRITSKQHLFRRCGVAHPKGVTEYPDDRFTEQEVIHLQAEPRLTVEIVEDEEQKDKPSLEEVMEAAKKAIEAGEVTSSGRPKVEAMAEILGENISAADRDEAFEKLTAEG